MSETRMIDDSHLWELIQLWDERRRALGIPEPRTDLAAIDLEVQRRRLRQKGAAIPRKVGHRTAFTSPNPRLDFEFLYPETWQVREFDQEGHSGVFILGPRNRDDTHSLTITVHVFPAWERKGKFATVAEVVEDYLRKSRQLASFREISRARGALVGVDAAEVEISYTIPLPINNVNAKETPIMERKIVFKKDSQFYELAYTAVAEDYYTYLESFRDAVSTFKFREEREEARVFQPLVTLTPTYAVREESKEYTTE
ncbi:MAG: hypothetical protein ACE5I2_10325 [Anaerolineae bacterium]